MSRSKEGEPPIPAFVTDKTGGRFTRLPVISGMPLEEIVEVDVLGIKAEIDMAKKRGSYLGDIPFKAHKHRRG